MTKIRKITIIFFIAIILFSIYVLYISITDYKPDEIILLPIYNNQAKTISKDEKLEITIFNLGYGGSGQVERGFKALENKSGSSKKEDVIDNLEGIVNVIDEINPDFLLLQELDTNSCRSFRINQLSYLNDKYPNYCSVYGKNYDVTWVPFPFFKVQRKIESGISIFSKYFATDAYRYSLPGQEDGFHKFFDYDRSFVEMRFDLGNGQELVIINLHLSDFNDIGLERQHELRYLQDYLKEERAQGSYIIVGGDWNHNLPGSDPSYLNIKQKEWPAFLKNLPEEFKVDGFDWVIDAYVPTVKFKNKRENNDFFAIIDGFLVSDNIEIQKVFAFDDGFKVSNHNPVTIEFILR